MRRQVLALFLGIPLLTACATATGGAYHFENLGMDAGTPMHGLSDFLGKLAENPLFKAADQDAKDTIAWVAVNVSDPLQRFRATQCPQAVLLATADFRTKVATYQVLLTGLDEHLKSAEVSGPHLILMNTKLRYGNPGNPKEQLRMLREDIGARVMAVADSCRAIIPVKQLEEVLGLAVKAGILGTTGPAGLLLP